MQKLLDSETTCGGNIQFIIKTTAYLNPNVAHASSIDDYETIGTWKLFHGPSITGNLFPLTTGNLRGKEIKIGIVNVSQ